MQASDEFWDDLLGYLGERMLVPFVGPDLLTLPESSGSATLWDAVAAGVAKRLHLEVRWTGGSPLNDVVGAYLAANDRTAVDRLYRVVNDTLRELAPIPSRSLRQLAAIRDFGLYVSTTCDSMLTEALNAERFAGSALTRELWFAPSQSTADQLANARPPANDETIVFKLFGRASPIQQFALHDEDVLEWLHSLLTETARLPDWLASVLRSRPLLFVGCRISDWVGRFLVRLASSTRLALAPKQLFIVGAAHAEEGTLAEFLQTYCGRNRVQVLTADPAEFVAELHRRWELKRPPHAPASEAEAPPLPRGSIFISYAREDVDAARRLRDAIEKLGGDAWLDERRLLPGDAWEADILRAVRRDVRLMVALVSENTERRDEGYVFKEWREGIERAKGILGRRFVLPAVIDPTYDGHPERYRKVPEGFPALQFGHAPMGEPDAPLTDALRQEIRAMRREIAR